MRWLSTLPLRLRSLFRRDRVEQDLRDELQFHLDALTERHIARGLSPEEARRATRHETYGLEAVKDRARDTWLPHWLQGLGQDFRLAVRTLRATPVVTAVVVLSLALGIGANTAVFSLVDTVLFKKLPGVEQPDHLITVYTGDRKSGRQYQGVPYPDFLDLRALPQVKLATYIRYPTSVEQAGVQRWTVTDFVSGEYFPLLGTRPVIGRLLNDSDDNPASPAVAVVSQGFVHGVGGDATIVGLPIVINRQPVTVVGVVPEGFRGPLVDWYGQWNVDVFLPLHALNSAVPRPVLQDRGFASPMVVGRLQPPFTFESAKAAVLARGRQLGTMFPQTNADRTWIVLPAQQARFFPSRWEATTRLLAILFASSCLILALCLCNVISLLIARAHARSQETAVRVAMGASRARLLRHSLVGSAFLVGSGATGGLAIAAVFVRVLSAYPTPFQVPLYQHVDFDYRSAIFGLVMSGVVASLVAIAPAVVVAQQSPLGVLKKGLGGGHPQRALMRRSLVVLQVAISVVVLTGGALLSYSLYYLGSRDPGFASDGITMMSIDAALAFKESRSIQVELERLIEKTRSLRGVVSVSLGDPPLGTLRVTARLAAGGFEPTPVLIDGVSPGYFSTLRIMLATGRDFSERDDTRTAVIVNQALAQRFWPGQQAVGQELFVQGETNPRRVVGVSTNVPYNDLWEAPQPCAYLPIFRNQVSAANVLVRTGSGMAPGELERQLRDALRTTSSDLSVVQVTTMKDHLSTQLSRQRLVAIVALILGPTALLLVMVGLSGLLTFTVQQQTHQIGIRMALGASATNVVMSVVRGILMLVGMGLAGGVVGWWTVQAFISEEIHGIGAADPVVLLSVAGVISAFALLVSYRPARRASRIDPAAVLREQ